MPSTSRACAVDDLHPDIRELARQLLEPHEDVRYCWQTESWPEKKSPWRPLFGLSDYSLTNHYGYVITGQRLVRVSHAEERLRNILDRSDAFQLKDIAEIQEQNLSAVVFTAARHQARFDFAEQAQVKTFVMALREALAEATPASTQNTSNAIPHRLQTLQQLLKNGQISQEEFAEMRRKILADL